MTVAVPPKILLLREVVLPIVAAFYGPDTIVSRHVARQKLGPPARQNA
jgi:hypothetical protein